MQRLAALFALAAAAPAPPHDAVTVTVGAPRAGCAPLPPNFASLSMEVPDAPLYFGAAGAPNAAFANLMRALQRASGGRGPSLRIGGNTADHSVFLPTGALPPNTTYRITQADLDGYAAALPAWDGRAVIDTNFFFENSTAWVAAHAAAVTASIGWDLIEGVEMGNEPEIYHDEGYRAPAWTFADYEREFEAHVAAAEAAGMPHGRVQGAVFCCHNPSYDGGFANYSLKYAARGDLASVSHHHYALGGCSGGPLTLAELLNSTAASAAYLAPFGAGARAAGVPFRVGEANSVSCGGRANISDVFGSALWALDFSLAAAGVGAAQINYHGSPRGGHYSAIAFPNLPASTVPDVRPLFYGLWAVSFATANASAVLNATIASSNAAIVAHALRGADGATRVALVHKDLGPGAPPARVVIVPAAGGGGGPAELRRLLVAGGDAGAARGITWAGLTFDGSKDGNPLGTPAVEAVARAADGTFAFDLPPRSAAVLVFV